MNAYTTVDAVRAVLERQGTDRDASILINIEGAARQIDNRLNVRAGAFIPETRQRFYRWPQDNASSFHRERSTLFLDEWLISLTALTSNNGANVIDFANDVFLEPGNYGPPFTKLEIDQSATASTAFFGANTTPQRAISATGSWGFKLSTSDVANLDGAIANATDTSVPVTDASKIGIGTTLLVDTEQMYVSAKDFADLAQDSSGALTGAKNDQTVTLDGAPTDPVVIGDFLREESEQMEVTGITSTTVFTVDRAVRGTTLATHADNTDVFIERTLTVQRGVNGTTAAAQLDDATVSAMVIPEDIEDLCIALAAAEDARGGQGWTAGNQPFNEASDAPKASAVSLAALWQAVLTNPLYNAPTGAMFGLAV